MKKANVRLLSCLLVSMFALGSFTSCDLGPDASVDPDSSIPSVPSEDSSAGSSEKTEATLPDIIDQENGRPDFDDMFDFESGYVPEEIPVPEPEVQLPADTGTKVKYRMEAENAEIQFSEYTGDNAWKNDFNDYNNLGFGLRLSGGFATRNCNTEGTKTIFKFKSDKSYGNIQLDVMYGGYPNDTLAVSDICDIQVNKTSIDTEGVTIDSSECEQLGHNMYMIFKLVTFKINIKEGDNEIVFNSLKARGNNFDYIELNTSAKITGWDSAHYEDAVESVWTVTKEPTLQSTGTLEVSSPVNAAETPKIQTYTLPMLSVANGYTVKELSDGMSEYSFNVKGQEYKYTVNTSAKSTLTLNVPDGVSFADGTKTAELKVGDALPEIKNTTGRAIAGWYNKETGATYTTNFSMPSEDCTITPYFDVKDGFKKLTIGNEQSGNLPNPVGGGAVKNNFSYKDNQLTAGGEGGFTELGRQYSYNGTLAAGAYFRLASVVDSSAAVVKKGVNNIFHFNIENKGATAIDLTLYMVNSTTNHETQNGEVNKPVLIQLAAGESMSFDYIANYALGGDNKNVMALFEVNSEMSDFSLSVSKSVKLGS